MEISNSVTKAVQAVTPSVLNADNFFGRNKTKLLALAIITVNYLQLPANAEILAQHVGENFFALVNMGLGLVALWLGFLNNPETTAPKE